MSLRDLIRGPAPRQIATAIPANLATPSAPRVRTIAKIASVAVAERPEGIPSLGTVAAIAKVAGARTADRGALWDAGDWRVFYDERAGVVAADGDLRLRDVEARAFECCVAEWLIRNPVRSDPGRCHACGESDAWEPLLRYETKESAHTWLHRRCWPAWYHRRKTEAVAELKILGIEGDAEASA